MTAAPRPLPGSSGGRRPRFGTRRKAMLFALPSLLRQMQRDGRDVLRMFGDRSFRIPRVDIFKLVAVGAYVVWPLDLIPNFIFLIGWVDDAVVLFYGMTVLGDLVERWRQHRRHMQARLGPEEGIVDADAVEVT